MKLYANDLHTKIENHIFLGEFGIANNLIDSELKKVNIDIENKIFLYQKKGDIIKLEGDIETALFYWEKANLLRNKVYAKNDYRKVWNFANLATYYYEIIQPEKAKIYADSCVKFTNNLTLKEQKEIKIHLIWNICTQVKKQQINDKQRWLYQKEIEIDYRTAIDFQLKHKTEPYYLAKTYHLLGNSFTDIVYYNTYQTPVERKRNFEKANYYYDQAINIWRKEFGEQHFELAKTYFLKSFICQTFENPNEVKLYKQTILNYKNSLNAFGIGKNKLVGKIPNNQDLLMTLRYYTELQIRYFTTHKNKKDLIHAEETNQKAITVWKNFILKANSKKINQNLAIYELNPYKLQIEIEIEKLKLKNELHHSHEKLFEANQYMRYYDYFKHNKNENKIFKTISLKSFQKKLKTDEIFIDYFNSGISHCLLITKSETMFIRLDDKIRDETEKLNKSILSFDYQSFVESGDVLFQILFSKIKINKYKRIIVSPQGSVI